MRLRRLALSVSLALCALLLLVGLASRAGTVPATSGIVSVEELALHPSGAAYEVNVDAQGMVWVSDYGAGEIRQVDPSTEVYTTYHGLVAPSDARGDAGGAVWWADGSSNRLGRLWLASGEATFWEMPGAWALYGTHIDAAGMVWVADFAEPEVYRLDPATDQVCTYTLPAGGEISYLTGYEGDVWLGDWGNDRVYRLAVASGTATYWQAPYDVLPQTVVRDSQGRLWWADETLGALAVLDPAASTLTRYVPPVPSSPAYAAVSEVGVWYTDGEKRVGLLQPEDATGVTDDVVSDTVSVTPSCQVYSPSASAMVTHTVSTASWSTVSYSAATETGGWWAYDLPEGGFPWGIDVGQGYAWFVDTNRYVLGRIPLDPWSAHRIYLPLVLRQ